MSESLPDRHAPDRSSPESPIFAELDPPYATIVADPPWAYRGRALSGKKRPDASASDQYATMTASDVAALPVAGLSAENAHAYLWCTPTLLFDEVTPADVLAAWGFRYVTMLTWVKRGPLGLGSYFRIDTEHIAFGVRGSLAILPADRQRNVFTASKSRHSVKPAAFGDLVERVSPGPYVELFARAPRLGWDSWGLGYEIGATA